MDAITDAHATIRTYKLTYAYTYIHTSRGVCVFICLRTLYIHTHTFSCPLLGAVSFVGSLTLTFIARDNNNVIKEKYNLILLFILRTNGVAFTRLLPLLLFYPPLHHMAPSSSSINGHPVGQLPGTYIHKSRALVRPLRSRLYIHWGSAFVHWANEINNLWIPHHCWYFMQIIDTHSNDMRYVCSFIWVDWLVSINVVTLRWSDSSCIWFN